MIKFKMLIHKETGTVIKYEEWLKDYQEDKERLFPNKKKSEKQLYQPTIAFDNFKASEMLFSDDFIIVYDSEFTTLELRTLHNEADEEYLRSKISETIGEREYLKFKYNIDL